MKRIGLFIFVFLLNIAAYAQWRITPTGGLVDATSGKEYMVIQKEGSQEELYKSILKNAHRIFIHPDDVVSFVENEMISITGYGETTMKYGLLNHQLNPKICVIIEFKQGKMRVQAAWVDVLWANTSKVAPYTFLSKGGLKCFNKTGEVSNKGRLDTYNDVSNAFINNILFPKSENEDW